MAGIMRGELDRAVQRLGAGLAHGPTGCSGKIEGEDGGHQVAPYSQNSKLSVSFAFGVNRASHRSIALRKVSKSFLVSPSL
jgi:hypothetical protein